MSERIELLDGAWANLRKPSAVPERLRRPVVKAMFSIAQGEANKVLVDAPEDLTDESKAAEIASSITSKTLDLYSDLNDLLIIARLESWSYDLPITLENVLDLPGGAYEILQSASAEGVSEMIPNFAASQEKDSPF